MLAINV